MRSPSGSHYSRRERTVCQMDGYGDVPAARNEFPAPAIKFPDPMKEFPDLLRREFRGKVAQGRALRAPTDDSRQPFQTIFPANSLLNREFAVETGSQLTTSSASYTPSKFLRRRARPSKTSVSAPFFEKALHRATRQKGQIRLSPALILQSCRRQSRYGPGSSAAGRAFARPASSRHERRYSLHGPHPCVCAGLVLQFDHPAGWPWRG